MKEAQLAFPTLSFQHLSILSLCPSSLPPPLPISFSLSVVTEEPLGHLVMMWILGRVLSTSPPSWCPLNVYLRRGRGAEDGGKQTRRDCAGGERSETSMGGCVGSHHDSSGSLNENSDGTGGKKTSSTRARATHIFIYKCFKPLCSAFSALHRSSPPLLILPISTHSRGGFNRRLSQFTE